MEFKAFHERFPKIGVDECRSLVLPDGGEWIPPGSYAFVEFYCSEITCDCRRVMLVVTNSQTGEPFASISFGFDRNGLMSGPFLDPLNRQCSFADEFLALAKELLLRDKEYVARLGKHYQMFKASLRGDTNTCKVSIGHAEVQQRSRARKAAKQLLRRLQNPKKKSRRLRG